MNPENRAVWIGTLELPSWRPAGHPELRGRGGRPKFQSRVECIDAELGLEPLPSPWDKDRIWHQVALSVIRSLPPDLRPYWRQYFDADAAVCHRLGRRRHEAYLRRTGGLVANYAADVPLIWQCCGREELIDEVNYDRHGNLRPEDEALVKARSYYHRCPNGT